MITGIVKSSDLCPKRGLRAQDYLIDPVATAKSIVTSWVESSGLKGLINIRSPQVKALIEAISTTVRLAYDRGQQSMVVQVSDANSATNAEAAKKLEAIEAAWWSFWGLAEGPQEMLSNNSAPEDMKELIRALMGAGLRAQ